MFKKMFRKGMKNSITVHAQYNEKNKAKRETKLCFLA